jgi:N12 class adenine-specific DNA methylase
LARWSSWGAIPAVFDRAADDWASERTTLRALLTDAEWDAAARTTLNAHYTDPAIAREMWRLLEALGFEGGRVLEPGSGAGTFIGLAPNGAAMTGVELDPVTAAISAALYPHATVLAESFADSRLPDGSFDAVIGNVPFSDVILHDPRHNRARLSMHNHFIVKSLALTRPGGIVVLLTSSFTLDARNPAARREMTAMADLVAAVRLPTGAHRRSAGTEVVTDLLVLRRRTEHAEAADRGWDVLGSTEVDGRTVSINRYFADHPGHVLGEMRLGQGMYGAQTLTVDADLGHLPERLASAVDEVVAHARAADLTLLPAATAPTPTVDAMSSATELWDDSIVVTGDGFAVAVEGRLEPWTVPKSAQAELRALLGLRDAAARLLDLEAATIDDTPTIQDTRSVLRRGYERYVARYGPVNRFTLRPTGRVGDDGEPTYARITPRAVRLLASDPYAPLVLALERFDEEDQTATPASILTERVVAPRPEVLGVETAADAVAVSLDRTGGVSLPLIADLLGLPEPDARVALEGLVFTDPGTGGLVHAPEYLSGDVRAKLDLARQHAATDHAYTANVTALQAVLPADLGIEDITPRLGAAWINETVHREFLVDLLGAGDIRVENPLPGMWEVRGGRYGLAATSEWGTLRRPAPDIAQALMEQKPLIVKDETTDVEGHTRQVVNAVETTAAQEKAEAMQARFADWLWEDPVRARTLVEEYNRRFNSIALRDYTGAGGYLTLPGLAADFIPRPHQRAAVARMIAEPAAGLFHEVGAGKTAEMIMGAMEMRRMGLITKPVLVVPNHMLEQFTREWLQIYPQARILTASSTDLTAEKRRLMIARAAATEWDGIVLTQGAFQKIPLRVETQNAYVQRQVDQVRAALDDAKRGDRMTVKRVQRRLLALENRLRDRIDTDRDAGICFEDTGIDYVIVDEIHLYKNLATESNIAGAAIAGSDRASDLHMKLDWLRSTGKTRIATGATATPISNSVTEAHVMQRYLRPDLLDTAGVGAFDAWAATFGQTVTQMEMAPTGDGTFRMKTRFAKFTNVPEMLRMWSVFADVKTAADLHLPTPDLFARADGKRAVETVPVQPTVELEAFITRLGERATDVAAQRVAPQDDNMLTISTDGRKAALDIRLVVPDTPSGPTKIDAAADAIHTTWLATRDNEYLDVVTGQPSRVRGALQLVFSDIGTPNPDRWNAYDELHLQLVQRGVPAEAIRFMHEAKNDAEKARLFAAARSGRIAVLIGSTEKMGVGTNVQARAVALYHLDCPWRPSDIAQREGRILRQGNQNPEVAIVRFVTERSFDAYMWQGVERKATFIGQIMRGRLDTREVDELDTTTLSAAEAKAISSGNPLLLELSTAQAEIGKLRRLQRAHERNEAMLAHTRDSARADLARAAHDARRLEAALPRAKDLSGDLFRIEIDGRQHGTRADAAQALASWTTRNGIRWLPRHASRDYGTIGRISDFHIILQARPGVTGLEIDIHLADVPRSSIRLTQETFLAGGIGLVQRLENRVSGIAALLAQARADQERSAVLVQESERRSGVPFRHTAALAETERLVERLERRLREGPAAQNAPGGDVSPRRQPLEPRTRPASRTRVAGGPSWPERN